MKCSECGRTDCTNPTWAGFAWRDLLPLVVFFVLSAVLSIGLVLL